MEAVVVLSRGEIDIATVSRIERGLVTPKPSTVVKLARALGVSAKRMAEIIAESSAPAPVEGA